MANSNKVFSFSRGKDTQIIFNSQGYVEKAKGFSFLIWFKYDENPDDFLIGKHVDEVSEIIKKNAIFSNEYENFEAHVHVPMLKNLLKNKNN